MSTAIGYAKPQCVQSSEQKGDDLRKAEKRNCKAPDINAHETKKEQKSQLCWAEKPMDFDTKYQVLAVPDQFNPGFTEIYDCENNAYFSMSNFNDLILARLCLFFYA